MTNIDPRKQNEQALRTDFAAVETETAGERKNGGWKAALKRGATALGLVLTLAMAGGCVYSETTYNDDGSYTEDALEMANISSWSARAVGIAMCRPMNLCAKSMWSLIRCRAMLSSFSRPRLGIVITGMIFRVLNANMGFMPIVPMDIASRSKWGTVGQVPLRLRGMGAAIPVTINRRNNRRISTAMVSNLASVRRNSNSTAMVNNQVSVRSSRISMAMVSNLASVRSSRISMAMVSNLASVRSSRNSTAMVSNRVSVRNSRNSTVMVSNRVSVRSSRISTAMVSNRVSVRSRRNSTAMVSNRVSVRSSRSPISQVAVSNQVSVRSQRPSVRRNRPHSSDPRNGMTTTEGQITVPRAAPMAVQADMAPKVARVKIG